MNKNMLRKLLAALMACAMLLCSAAAFAEEETESSFAGIFAMPVPEEENETSAEPEVPEEGETVETEESAETPAEDESEEAAAEDEADSSDLQIKIPEFTASESNGEIATMSLLKDHTCVFEEEPSDSKTVPYYDSVDKNNHALFTETIYTYRCVNKSCTDYYLDSVIERTGEPEEHEDRGDGWCSVCYNKIGEFDEYDKTDYCEHPIDWNAEYTIFDSFEVAVGAIPSNESAGHFVVTYQMGTAPCTVEDDDKTAMSERTIYVAEAHSFKDNKCTICGYTKTTTATKDEPVRSATGMVNEIKALVADGAVITITDEAVAYTADELFAVSAISDPVERVLVLMAALDLGDEVDHTVAWLGLTLSDEAKALIETVKARVAAEGVTGEALLAFPVVSETINGKVYDAIHIELVATKVDGTAITETFCFYKDGSKWYFNTVETV